MVELSTGCSIFVVVNFYLVNKDIGKYGLLNLLAEKSISNGISTCTLYKFKLLLFNVVKIYIT